MPIALTVLVGVVGLVGTVLGALTVRTWDPSHDPDYFRDTVQQGVVALLRLGLLLLLITTTTIAVVGSLAAHRGHVAIPRGVWVCAVVAAVLSVGFARTYLRQRSRRVR